MPGMSETSFRVARVCPGMHLGDERHYVYECPAVEDNRRCHSRLFDDSHERNHVPVHVASQSEGYCVLLVANPR